MTILGTTFFEAIPDFDCVEWKKQVQAEVLRKTDGMTDGEIREYFRQGAERFDEKIKRFQTESMEPGS